MILFLWLLAVSVRADTSLVFNEIMYHPSTNESTMEWVEVYNQMAVDLDISGWSISGGVQYTFPANTVIHGSGYLVVASSPTTLVGSTGLTNIIGPFTGQLTNTDSKLQLRNNNGRVVDEIHYDVEGDWPVAANGAGVSLAKRDRETASGPAEDWTTSDQPGGTPGTANFPPSGGLAYPVGLVSYWNFNEAVGASAVDQVGQNNGILGTGVTHVTNGIVRALSFNGTTNAFVNTGTGISNNFAVSGGITVEAVLLPGWSGTNSAVIFKKTPPKPVRYRDAVLTNNPLAYWRLGDLTTTIADSTTNAHIGTATAGVLLNQPGLIPSEPTNAAVRATGTERITVPGFEKIGSAGYTVEFWVKVYQVPSGCCQNLVGDGESGDDFFMMNYILGPFQGQIGSIRPHFSGSGSPVSIDSPTALQAGNTYHIVTTWDASNTVNNAVIYINGVANSIRSVTSAVPAPGTTGDNKVYIGYDDREAPDGNYTYDEVALYNHPLSAADVAAHYAAATVTNFDVTQGNSVQLALQNDGNNAQANPPVAAGPVLSFGLTVGGVYSELDMPLDGAAGRPTLADLENGQPHHVAAAYNSATGVKAIYVDGALRFSNVLSGTVNANNSANAVIGNAEVNGRNPFVGTLDEVAYWSRGLTSAEIAAHSAAIQAGRDYFTTTSSNSVTTLVFNELSAATNAEFWVELKNYGATAAPLAGCVIVRSGPTNGEYVFPSGPTIAAGGYYSITNTTLGFHPVSGDKLFLLSPGRNKVLDAVVVKQTARARSPDGTGPWLRPSSATAGGANSFTFHNEVVINE
ncbi:MAG TPA: LamG-like jellyroll fold domain-containing protein, partial [Desulfuromonadaceae bacterium]|nr:LamG-like jellyroll fold domain-containing protein [Desulfuromonadaceae bacterium]